MQKATIRRVILTITLVLGIISMLTAQGAPEGTTANSDIRRAIDALGREVSVSGDIQRIMVVGKAAIMPADALFLFPGVEDIEVTLAKTDQGLGDFFNLIRPEFAHSNRLGQQVGAEEIFAYNPSLVLTKSSNYDSIGKLLEPFGIPVFVMDLETPESWKSEIVQLGKLLGDEQTPQRIIGAFEKRQNAVSSKVGMLSEKEKPGVLMMQVASSDGLTSFSVSPENWIQHTITTLAGGKAIWVDSSLADNAWRKVSFEQIASWQPEHIFLISYKTPVQPFLAAINESPQWQQLAAVKQARLQATPADVLQYFQSDIRWILALQWLAAELHPQLFPNFSMENEIRGFYRDFYGIEDENILATLVQKYRTSVE